MKNLIAILFVAVLAALLNACGGSSDDPADVASSPSALKGTVAVGAPLVATITIVDAEGEQTTTSSDASGKYVVEMASAKGPFLIKVVPGDSAQPTLYSYSTGAGVANASQFTSLGLLLAKNADLEDAFNNWATVASTWTRSDIENAVAVVNANLADALTDNGQNPKTFDIFTIEFDANGQGVDAFLDEYTVEIDYTARTYNVTDSGGTEVSINENIDISDFYIGALFALAANTDWTLTMSFNYNGQQMSFLTDFPVNAEDVPLSRARFIEDSWYDIGDQTFTYSDETGSITVSVTQYTPSYSVTGDGGVGTVVEGGLLYSYRVQGNIASQQIDETYTYTWNYTYKRVS